MARPSFRLEGAGGGLDGVGAVGWGEREGKEIRAFCSAAVLFVALFLLCVWR